LSDAPAPDVVRARGPACAEPMTSGVPIKRLELLAVLFVVAIGFSGHASAAFSRASRFVHASGTHLFDADGRTLQLRGINLGNWLVPEGYMFGLDGGPASPREIEAFVSELIGPADATQFWHAFRRAYITEEDIRFLSQAGVNSIRIPLHYKFFMPGNEEGFTLVDRVVGWARKYHIYVVLDLHCAPGGQTGANIDDSWGYPWLYESEDSQAMTVAVWKRIAGHYRDNPSVLGYDLLNEPIPEFPALQKYNSKLEPIYKVLTAAIRTVDKNHVIILGGAQWDSNFAIFGVPFDANLMYTFHKYWTAPTKEVIRSYLDFRDHYNVPIWLGESGENNDAWIHDFVQVLEKEGIGWAFWPYKKAGSASSFLTWQNPAYWDEISAYGRIPGNSSKTAMRIAARPSLEHSRAAFQSLLENIRFVHCEVNPGYIQALNLTVP
jgi:aryl-phospho-beta-D-glucosidase BglC (GH1 family)